MPKTKKSKFEDLIKDRTIPFRFRARVHGNFGSSYVFQTVEQLQHWKREYLPLLEKQYGPLRATVENLPGFKVGDTCGIQGEAFDEFRIESVIKYGPYRYGYVLHTGVTEEVAKSFDVVAAKLESESDFHFSGVFD